MPSRRTKKKVVKKRTAKRNPVPPSRHAKVTKAIDLFREFRGMDPEYIDTVQLGVPSVGLLIGHLDFVGYTTVRDGKTEKYIHEFSKKARPLLASSHDGQQLIILGGEYDFTELGIVDRK